MPPRIDRSSDPWQHVSRAFFATDMIRFDEFEIDRARRRLICHGEVVPLHSKAFDLLDFLVANAGRVVSKEEILAGVWEGKFVEESNLVVQISHIRKALGETGGTPRFLITVPGRGYKFAADTGRLLTVETVIEDTRTEEIVIEEKEYLMTSDTSPAKSIRRLISSRVMAATALILLATGTSYVLYRQTTTQPTLMTGWTDSRTSVSVRQLTADGKIHMATLSPDGNFFAYTTGQSEASALWVQGIDGSEPVQVVPASSRIFIGLTFAPDNRQIYFTARDPSNPSGALFRVPMLGGLAERVLQNVAVPVSFSPDGAQVVFVRDNKETSTSSLIRASVVGEPEEREIASRPASYGYNPSGAAWSPDGRRIAVGGIDDATKENVVLLVGVDDGTTQKLGDTAWTYVRRVEWLPDGSGVFANVIAKEFWQERHIWLIDARTGASHRVTRDVSRYGRETVSVSADGMKLLGVSAQTVSNVFVGEHAEPESLRMITVNAIGKRDGANNSLAWTHEGKIIVSRFFDKSEALWVMESDGGSARQLTASGNSDRKPVISRDGRHIVFYSYRNGTENLWRIDADGGNLRQLTFDGGSAPSLTPDSSTVYYEANGGVWTVPIEGGTPVRVTAEEAKAVSVEVSPDGTMFATFYRVPGGEWKLAIFLIEGRAPLHTFGIPADVSFPKLRWTPDGSGVVYCFYNSKAWRQPLSGGEPEIFMEFPGEVINAFAWSWDGTRFAVSHGKEIRDVVLFSTDSN